MRFCLSLGLTMLLFTACGSESAPRPAAPTAPPTPAAPPAPPGPDPACEKAETELAQTWSSAQADLRALLPRAVERRDYNVNMSQVAAQNPSGVYDLAILEKQVAANTELGTRLEAALDATKTPNARALEALVALVAADAEATKHGAAQSAYMRENRRKNLTKIVELAKSTGNNDALTKAETTLAELDAEARAEADSAPVSTATRLHDAITAATAKRDEACK